MIPIWDLKVADPGELVAVFDAVQPGFAATAQAATTGVAAFLADRSSFALGAYADGRPAGFAWGLQMISPTGRRTSYLHQLEVDEQFRRRGVGSALVLEAMAVARRLGSTRFWLSTGGHNEGAQALYHSLGGDRKPLGDVNYWWQLD